MAPSELGNLERDFAAIEGKHQCLFELLHLGLLLPFLAAYTDDLPNCKDSSCRQPLRAA